MRHGDYGEMRGRKWLRGTVTFVSGISLPTRTMRASSIPRSGGLPTSKMPRSGGPPTSTVPRSRGAATFLKAAFKGDADFKGATFGGAADFNSATFEGDTNFIIVTFKGDADFTSAPFRGACDFLKATFETGANFTGATFDKDANFVGVTLKKDAYFEYGTFKEGTYFGDATFKGGTYFSDATFEGDTDFTDATFEGFTNFTLATFEGDTNFVGATFKGDTYFWGAVANRIFVFLHPWENPKPFAITRHGETGYRLAKQAARNAGDYRSSGHYHYAEQCAINSRHRKDAVWRPWKTGFWWSRKNPMASWGEFVIGRCLFGYGERPLRVVWATVAVILCWTCIYWIGGVVVGETEAGAPIIAHEFASSLYFSITTFTTLGYGDFSPLPSLRLWAGFEAVLGAGLMALFIVALARKFTR